MKVKQRACGLCKTFKTGHALTFEHIWQKDGVLLGLNKSSVNDSLFNLLYVHGTSCLLQDNLHENNFKKKNEKKNLKTLAAVHHSKCCYKLQTES